MSLYLHKNHQTFYFSVPKTIMHNMVNYVKEHLQSQLVGVLYKPEDIKELLKESDDVCEKRIEAIKMLEVIPNLQNSIFTKIYFLRLSKKLQSS